MKVYWLILGALAVWRLTHLLQAEDGPWDLIAGIRRNADGTWMGKALDCFYCLSMWIAAPAAYLLAATWPERAWLWPALSAAAILLERVTQTRTEIRGVPYVEDADPAYGMLRTPEGGADA